MAWIKRPSLHWLFHPEGTLDSEAELLRSAEEDHGRARRGDHDTSRKPDSRSRPCGRSLTLRVLTRLVLILESIERAGAPDFWIEPPISAECGPRGERRGERWVWAAICGADLGSSAGSKSCEIRCVRKARAKRTQHIESNWHGP